MKLEIDSHVVTEKINNETEINPITSLKSLNSSYQQIQKGFFLYQS